MKKDVNSRERESYKDSGLTPGGENKSLFSNALTRRGFLKQTGGASAASMLAMHGMKVEILASESVGTLTKTVVYHSYAFIHWDGENGLHFDSSNAGSYPFDTEPEASDASDDAANGELCPLPGTPQGYDPPGFGGGFGAFQHVSTTTRPDGPGVTLTSISAITEFDGSPVPAIAIAGSRWFGRVMATTTVTYHYSDE